jgi:hypothetical protein
MGKLIEYSRESRLPMNIRTRRLILLALGALLLFVTVPPPAECGRGWLIYHESSFKGRVIDTETKEPIEGAVVVARYKKDVYAFVESRSVMFDVREALTDEKGEFSFPSKWDLIQPLSVADETKFIAWKPGYKAETFLFGWFFREEPGTVIERWTHTEKGIEMKPVRVGIVELVPAKTKEERRQALIGPTGAEGFWKKQKEFIRMIREEYERKYGEPAGDLYLIDDK